MTRINTRQAAVARPTRIAVEDVPDVWLTILEAFDYSVPDTTKRWPENRDPLDDDRRIQPGQALIEAPLLCTNIGTTRSYIELQVVLESLATISLGQFYVPPFETLPLPLPGQALLKLDPATDNGDRLQVRAQLPNHFTVWGMASVGAADQDLPVSQQ